MEKKVIKYPKIGQFTNAVQTILRKVNFVGLDENGDAIYDPSVPKPTITFHGTVKLHGTNASVAFNSQKGIWYQSRENIITPEKDNAGFAFYAESNKDAFMRIIHDVAADNDIDMFNNTITVYGEWAGKGIQKNVAISELDKTFYLFGIKISPFDTEKSAYWVEHAHYDNPEAKIINIEGFDKYTVEVDFNNPKLSQNKFVELTEEVEKECPVAKTFGVSGIGEGIVWTGEYKGNRYMFKTKGDKHAGKSKVKKTKKVDNAKLQLIINTVDKVTPVWRLDQMLTKACDLMNGGHIDRSKLGDYIRLVIKDIMEEEQHVINDAGLEPKDINKKVSEVARMYFFEQERERMGL